MKIYQNKWGREKKGNITPNSSEEKEKKLRSYCQ